MVDAGSGSVRDSEPGALRLGGTFRAAGVTIGLRTDSISVVCAAEELFTRIDDALEQTLSLRIRTDPALHSLPPWPQPGFRAEGDRFHVEFGSGNAFEMHLPTREVIATVSPAMSHDVNYWKSMVLPACFGTMCYTAGTCVLHCACLARDGQGLLLAAPAGTGKSTLSYALAKVGYDYLSDDWTYLHWQDGRLMASGLPVPMKLLADCVQWFPELSSRSPALTANGELAYEFDPADMGLGRIACCEATQLVFLERGAASGLSPITADHAALRFRQDFLNLPECFTGYDTMLDAVANALSAPGAYVYAFDKHPMATAKELACLLDPKEVTGAPVSGAARL